MKEAKRYGCCSVSLLKQMSLVEVQISVHYDISFFF